MAALPLDVATGIVAGRLTRAAAPGTIGEPIPDARVTLTPEFGIAAAPHASPSATCADPAPICTHPADMRTACTSPPGWGALIAATP